MKKISILLVILSFILSGCFNPASVAIVEDMYTEALVENDEGVMSYFGMSYLEAHPIEELADELAEQVRYAQGVKLLNIIEVRQNQLNSEIVADLDETYQDEWHFIVLDAPDEQIMTWVVLKTASQYEIVDGELISIEEYQEDVLKKQN